MHDPNTPDLPLPLHSFHTRYIQLHYDSILDSRLLDSPSPLAPGLWLLGLRFVPLPPPELKRFPLKFGPRINAKSAVTDCPRISTLLAPVIAAFASSSVAYSIRA